MFSDWKCFFGFHKWNDWKFHDDGQHVRYCDRNNDHKQFRDHEIVTDSEIVVENILANGGQVIDAHIGLAYHRREITIETSARCSQCGHVFSTKMSSEVDDCYGFGL